MRLIKNLSKYCLRLFGHVKLFFIDYHFRNYKMLTTPDLFRYRLKRFYRKIIRFKIIFRIIRFDKIEYSYLIVDLGEIRSSNNTRERSRMTKLDGSAYKNLLNDGTKRWNKTYNWDALCKDIKRYGLLTPLEVRICNKLDPEVNKYCRYCVVDGNHRVTILKELYSSTHKVKVKISNSYWNRDNKDIFKSSKEKETLRIKTQEDVLNK